MVTILPLLLLLSYLGILTLILGGCYISSFLALDILATIVFYIVPPDRLGISASTARTLDIVMYTSLSGLTAIVTGLIVVRLLFERRRHVRAMGTCIV